jgi:hypothetical protein
MTESHADSEDPLASDFKPIPLRSVNAAMSYLPAIDAAHKQVTAEMESMAMSGLANVVSISNFVADYKLLIIFSESVFASIRASNSL